MTVNFSSSIPVFKSEQKNTETCQCEHHICPQCGKPIEDKFDKPKEKKGFLTRAKDGFINARKFFIDAGYLIGGTVKGLLYGTAAGGVVLAGNAVKNTFKNAPKALSTKGKLLAGAVGTIVLAYNVVKAKLNANQSKANLDHRWETGHNE